MYLWPFPALMIMTPPLFSRYQQSLLPMTTHILRPLWGLLLVLACLPLAAQQNVIKVAPGKLTSRSLALTYERVLSDNKTVSVDLHSFFPRSPRGQLQSAIDAYNSDTFNISNLGLSGFTFTPAYRHYFGGNAPRGFYFSPFARFFQYTGTWNVDYQGVDQQVMVDGRLRFRGLGGGLSLGFQFLIAERISVDWHGGLGVTLAGLRHRGELDTQNVLPQDIQDFEDQINAYLDENIGFINKRVNFDDGLAANFRIPGIIWPVLRSSLAIGVAF